MGVAAVNEGKVSLRCYYHQLRAIEIFNLAQVEPLRTERSEKNQAGSTGGGGIEKWLLIWRDPCISGEVVERTNAKDAGSRRVLCDESVPV